jgi:deoxyribose-phosphate aldolase
MAFDELIEQIRERIAQVTGIAVAPVAGHPVQVVSPDAPLAGYIDHTLLKPEATPAQIDDLCREAREHGFASVCVNPLYVEQCARALADTKVAVCSVVGFPLGATTSQVKVIEARQTIERGAREIDMVLPIGEVKGGGYTVVFGDIERVVSACHSQGALCKVIIETALLDDAEKVAACLLAASAGADFVKTSTGFAAHGATVEDVALMRQVVGPHLGVKASGGIRSVQDARAMLAAGATRLGASASVHIVAGEQQP